MPARRTSGSPEGSSTKRSAAAKRPPKGTPPARASRTKGATTPTTKKATTATPAAGDDGRPPPRPLGRAGAPAQGRELRARGQRTVRKLLDAGIEVFGTRGYHAARVDDIVKAAATSHGTFYLYFANKEDLFQALLEDVAEQMVTLGASLGRVGPEPSGRAELRAWLARFAELYDHYGPIMRTWTEAEVDTSRMGRLGTDLLGDLATAIAGSVPSGLDDDLDPLVASLAFVAMVERFNYFVQSKQVDAHRDEMLDTLADVMHAGLYGR